MAGHGPDLFAVFHTQCRQTAADSRVKGSIAKWSRRSRPSARQIGDCRIDFLVIAGHAPLDASVDASLPDAGLPKNFAFLVRIQRVDDTRFLPRSQNVPTVCQVD